MAQRKYSISEIDQMRNALLWMASDSSGTEDRLRTHMLNGTDPEELRAAALEYIARQQENRRFMWEQEQRMHEAIKRGAQPTSP